MLIMLGLSYCHRGGGSVSKMSWGRVLFDTLSLSEDSKVQKRDGFNWKGLFLSLEMWKRKRFNPNELTCVQMYGIPLLACKESEFWQIGQRVGRLRS